MFGKVSSLSKYVIHILKTSKSEVIILIKYSLKYIIFNTMLFHKSIPLLEAKLLKMLNKYL